VGAAVSVEVENSDWMSVGQNIFITVGGYYKVDTVTDSTNVVLENLGSSDNAAPAATVNTNKKVSPAGYIMPDASMDANSIKGNPTASSAAPSDIAVANNQFLARSSTSNLEAKTVSDFAFTILDDLNGAAVCTTISAVPTSRAVNTQYSITGGGNLSADRTLNLVGDEASPGAYQFYGTDSTGTKGWQAMMAAYNNCQVFTSDDTWTKPADLTGAVLVICTGAGGAGGAADSGIPKGTAGESGATAIKIIPASSLGATEAVTVGVGGVGTTTGPGTGGTGGTSSFGVHCSAEGGLGGYYSAVHDPETPADATGGNINLKGSSMGGAGNYVGGSSFWGCGHSAPGLDGDGTQSLAYGAGGPPGAGDSAVARKGGDGADGIVVVLWS